MVATKKTKTAPVAKSVAPKVVATKTKVVADFDPYTIIKHPLSTEKSIRQVEFDNKLVFIVTAKATKADVKKAVEMLFKVRVVKVNIQNSFTGQKKAYVKIGKEHLASDIGADLGMI